MSRAYKQRVWKQALGLALTAHAPHKSA